MADVDPEVLREFEAALDQILPGPAKAAKKALVSVFKRTTSQGKLSSALEADQVLQGRVELINEIRQALADDFENLESRHDQLMNIFLDYLMLHSNRKALHNQSALSAMLALVEDDIQRQAEFPVSVSPNTTLDVPFINSNYLCSAEALTDSLHLGIARALSSLDEAEPDMADVIKEAIRSVAPSLFKSRDHEYLSLKLNCVDDDFDSQVIGHFVYLGYHIYRLAFLETGDRVYSDQGTHDTFDNERQELIGGISNILESFGIPALAPTLTRSDQALEYIATSIWEHFAKRSQTNPGSRTQIGYGKVSCTLFTVGLEATLHTITDSGDLSSESIWDDFAPGSRADLVEVYSREFLFKSAASIGLKAPADQNLSDLSSYYLDMISATFLRDVFESGGLLAKILMADIVLAKASDIDDPGVQFLIGGRRSACQKMTSTLSPYGLDIQIPSAKPGDASASIKVIEDLDRIVALIHRDLRTLFA